MRRFCRDNGLSLAAFGLFLLFVLLMSVTGNREYNEDQREHGFESMQNWQSEFLAVGSLVTLSVFLRQKGSPESEPVDHRTPRPGGRGPPQAPATLCRHDGARARAAP